MSETIVIKIDPPQVDDDDVEDFLATDDLFVEYFNTYLALPSFPEPLCFNKESGGFEVVSEARHALAQQIKAAIRSQRRTPNIYRVAKRHAFIDIPLIPIVTPDGPEKMEIDTSFSVTTLNKEQGIHWVKAERLPTFLNSDCYFEYRLGNVLSQVKLMDTKGHFILTKIDYTPRPQKTKKKQEEVKVDLKEVYIKNMFVSLGDTSTQNTDSWFSQAKMAHLEETTYVSLSRPVSASRPIMSTSSSARPASENYRALRQRPDSGISSVGSPQKSSVFSSPYFGSYGAMPLDEFSMPRSNTAGSLKPVTPRPSDPVCVTDDDGEQVLSSVVYAYPKDESIGSESGMGDVSEMDNDLDNDDTALTSDGELQSLTSGKEEEEDEERAESKQSVVVHSVDELSAVIVGAVMKKAMADVAKIEQSVIEKDPRISKVFPNAAYAHISTDMLDNIIVIENPPQQEQHQQPPQQHQQQAHVAPGGDHGARETKKVPKGKADDNESDVDSLLDSEEDYEEDDVNFFRRHKRKRTYNLSTRKGLQQFKRFLRGTAGENMFYLWTDIDKLVLVTSEEEEARYLSGMREKYHKHGAPYELTSEFKASLGLSEPSQWTVEKLQAVQCRVADPLVLYWAPRFLLKQLYKSNPARYQQYQEQHLNLLPRKEVYPNPPTMTLLPLRPKSCYPKLQQHRIVVQDLWEREPRVEETLPLTTPRVGMRRVHGPSAIKPPTPPRPGTEVTKKKPRELLMAHLKAHDHLSKLEVSGSSGTPGHSKPSSAKSRPKSSKAPSLPTVPGRRATSPGSDSAESWDNASVASLDRAQKDRLNSATVSSEDKRSRPRTAPSQRVSSAASGRSSSSQFEGGRRLEALLQALYHEKDSGHFFRAFLRKSNNKRWLDAAQFWEDVQEYRMMFYQDAMDLFVVKKHAQGIYSKYIVSGAPRNIGCPTQVRLDVLQCLVPPQEELFDLAEEEALKTLYTAWMTGLTTDMQTYSKVELIEVKRHLETKNKYVLNLQRSGLIKERPLTPDEPMEGYDDPVYDPAAWEAVPEEFRDYTLEKLVHNRLELEHFKQFLAEKYADTDLKCWMDVEAWRRITPAEERKRDQKSKDIKKAYLNKKYFFGPNSPAGKEGQDKVMQTGGGWGKLLEDKLPNAVLLEAQKYVRERLEQKWLPLFLVTEPFAYRQRPKTNMDDVVDDVLVQKRRRSQAVWKMLESRWVSSSKEILTFRKALMNPVTSHQFRRFVSIKGDNLENDVLFWQEVQKYKQMHHVHTEDSLLSQKITAIINCFIDSQIPPSLQVDLPQEMADRVLDRKYEKSPYLFREAQLALFRILFSHWNKFCELRMKIGTS
ncbi:regulator of G-protein signaling 22-like isoform X2 [Littorina saxatilis]|uniref:regulator of G-protein signaling 22-like isoform X2 n=1 Tax=Littorina saxatilis TaxID=31220 RepID=UPI0038B48FDB